MILTVRPIRSGRTGEIVRWDLEVHGGCQGQYSTVASAKAAAKWFAHPNQRLRWRHDPVSGVHQALTTYG
jgi:hypothetical protein